MSLIEQVKSEMRNVGSALYETYFDLSRDSNIGFVTDIPNGVVESIFKEVEEKSQEEFPGIKVKFVGQSIKEDPTRKVYAKLNIEVPGLKELFDKARSEMPELKDSFIIELQILPLVG